MVELSLTEEIEMAVINQPSRAHEITQLWTPLPDPAKQDNFLERQSPLFGFLYKLSKEEYKNLPKRKDGTDPFFHPLQVAYNLTKANAADLTISVGMIHDFAEEKVDLLKREKAQEGIILDAKSLDDYEEKTICQLEQKVCDYARTENIELESVSLLTEPLRLLTRHKRHKYYRSIAEIFRCKDLEIKERAIQVKLADRLHNILTLNAFDEEKRIEECFKNIFILNNTKKYLMHTEKWSEETDIIYPLPEKATSRQHFTARQRLDADVRS